jgi:nanoRNase/pAp phosphatase (c-di-AMP/oligoRNAs hydrolase)
MKTPKQYALILKAIQKYPKIVVFRHIIPDFDALGTQLGLATWIKENFTKKTVKVIG